MQLQRGEEVLDHRENMEWQGWSNPTLAFMQLQGFVVVPEAPQPEPTIEQTIADMTAGLETYYDSVAQTRRYDNRITCTLRAGYPGPFQAEGLAFALWMDTCNAYGYGVITEVLAGQRTIPTLEELISELPTIEWPE